MQIFQNVFDTSKLHQHLSFATDAPEIWKLGSLKMKFVGIKYQNTPSSWEKKKKQQIISV